MAKRKKIIVGNWKMNPQTVEEAKKIFLSTKRAVSKMSGLVTIICPPGIYLLALAKLADKSGVRIGTQDVFWQNDGPFTGELSPAMAYNAGARYAIIGHSEKRALGDTNEIVADKMNAALSDGLVAILCVGEKERDHEGNYLGFLKDQLVSSLKKVSPNAIASKVIIAYEPVWEIGRQDMHAMKPSDVHSVSIFIKKILNDTYGNRVALEVPILYGGSVSPLNAKETVFQGGVDGLLVGRMSVEQKSLSEIILSVVEGE